MRIIGEEIQNWRRRNKKVHCQKILRLHDGRFQNDDQSSIKITGSSPWHSHWEHVSKWKLSSGYKYRETSFHMEGLKKLSQALAQWDEHWKTHTSIEKWRR